MRIYTHRGATPRHTLYRSTHATNCNRLENEVVKWRSPCVWPLLISCNVVFYVMPCSPRTLCSLLRLINTLNQTVPLWHPWACVRVRSTQDLFLCTTQVFLEGRGYTCELFPLYHWKRFSVCLCVCDSPNADVSAGGYRYLLSHQAARGISN